MNEANNLLRTAQRYLGERSTFLGELLSDPEAFIDQMPVGVFLADVSNPKQLNFAIANPAFQELVGSSCRTDFAYGWSDLADRWDARDLVREIKNCSAGGEACSFDWFRPSPHGHRRIGVSLKPVRDSVGNVVGILAILSDKSGDAGSLREAIQQSHDDLTGLPNRAALTALLERLERTARSTAGFDYGVLSLNIDRFQTVNETLGHVAGDKLLCLVRDRLLENIGAEDMLARVSGDEFVVVRCFAKGQSNSQPLAELLQDSMRDSFNIGGQEVFVSLSAGVADRRNQQQNPMDLLRDADLALHKARTSGNGRIVCFRKDDHEQTRSLLHMENDLRRAVEYKEFELHYQPIVDLESGAVRGFEALCRWQNGDKGAVSPTDFIPLAEDIGLIEPIGAWALETACAQLREWQTDEAPMLPLSMSVNVSGLQLSQRDFVPTVRRALENTGLSGQHLHLEITETVLLESPERAYEILSDLKDLGVSLVMDDFGTGYSSLAQINRFPLDALKIDRAFVSRIDEESGHKIIQVISLLADALDLDVIAEGVETNLQLASLKSLYCPRAQGFLFAKPMPASEIEEFLTSDWSADIRTSSASH